jgi:hypothetical protein
VPALVLAHDWPTTGPQLSSARTDVGELLFAPGVSMAGFFAGYGASSYHWRYQIPALADAGYQVSSRGLS